MDNFPLIFSRLIPIDLDLKINFNFMILKYLNYSLTFSIKRMSKSA